MSDVNEKRHNSDQNSFVKGWFSRRASTTRERIVNITCPFSCPVILLLIGMMKLILITHTFPIDQEGEDRC